MNPFLSKPLKKVQQGGNLKNSSQEHRPSKYINPNLVKTIKTSGIEKKNIDSQKIKNPSPKDKNIKNNINIINPNKPVKEEEKNVINITQQNKIEINNKEEIITDEKEKAKKEEKKENNSSKKISNNLKIENNIKFMYPKIKIDNNLIFKNNDEIIDYIKNQMKEGKIKNILQKLELKKNDFTGFTLSKKNQGYTIYEIEFEDNIEKINETIKKQKVEINKKQVELRYVNEIEPTPIKNEKNVKNEKNEKNEKTEKNEAKDKKVVTENKKPENLIHAMKNKTIERETVNLKNDKINSDIKNLQNKIHKQKQELRKAENENDYIKKEAEKKAAIRASNRINYNNPQTDNDIKSKRRESGLKIKINEKKVEENGPVNTMPNANEKPEKKKMTIEENQRRVSRAYVRFKKAFSSQKKEEDKGPGNSEKIQSLAAILQEHIIKPLAEIQEENEGKQIRGGSVECRSIKPEGMVELLENAPVQKKNVKKPKNVNFGE